MIWEFKLSNIGLFTFLFLSIVSLSCFSQDSVRNDGFQRFFYPDGKVSSEGFIRNGKPDGYWKSFYQNGILKSEGTRKNFELDSIWRFYNEAGRLVLEINYRLGRKHGYRSSYLDKETIREFYRNDVKEGFTKYYYPDGKIKLEIPFSGGLEQGFGKEYGSDGTVVTLTEYKKGFIVDRMRINRKDAGGRRQGKWFTFYENGNIQTEGVYKDDLKNGYFKEYAENGDLIRILKYVEGSVQAEAAEIQKLEVQKEYYSNGKIRVSSMFRNGIPEGIRKEYDTTGKIEKAQLFKNGHIVGEGIVKEDGNREGSWKEYYEDGSLKAEGAYENDKPVGKWKYYYQSGKTEQTGSYTRQGKKDGVWKWFYETGALLREETYRSGLKDGLSTEYEESGKVIIEGDFIDDLEDGQWFEITGDSYIRGSYRDGLRNGMWYYMLMDTTGSRTDSVLMYRGNFIDDNPDGRHSWFWDNGRIKEEGNYVMGRKEGDWSRYNYDGSLFMVITYREGAETKFDGVKIKPPFEKEEN